MFSSVVHSSWILAIISINKIIWTLYISIYFLLIWSISYYLALTKINGLNKITSTTLGRITFINFIICIISIAGLPPLLGFFPKIIVIQAFIENWSNTLIVTALILRTLIALIFYLKIIIGILLKNNSSIIKIKISDKFIPKFLLINTLGALILVIFITF